MHVVSQHGLQRYNMALHTCCAHVAVVQGARTVAAFDGHTQLDLPRSPEAETCNNSAGTAVCVFPLPHFARPQHLQALFADAVLGGERYKCAALALSACRVLLPWPQAAVLLNTSFVAVPVAAR